MKKVFTTLIIMGLITVAAIVGVKNINFEQDNQTNETVIVPEDSVVLNDEQREIIDETAVIHELKKINESYFAEHAFSDTHTNAKEADVTKATREYLDKHIGDDINVNDWKVWEYNTKSLTIGYTGRVMVGYNMDDVEVSVVGDKIYVSIPKQKDSFEFKLEREAEKDGWLTKVQGEDRVKIEEDARKKEFKEAETAGIRQKAEDNFKKVVTEKLSCFNGYTVEFKEA